MKAKNNILLYGATGYTGTLIAELAREQNMLLTIAGRNKDRLQQLATRLQFHYEIADLQKPDDLHRILQGVKVVLHAAGPFCHTAAPMIEACLRARVHYVDITGEIEVFEMAKQYHKAAVAAGIVILPGAGFDVVPTDCLSLYLKNKLPSATHLKLAFTTKKGGLSHGTASTIINGLGKKGMERRDGRLTSVALGKYSMLLSFEGHEAFMMSIPWGDISTAFHTTGIPNIRTYTGVSRKAFVGLKFQALYNWLLRTKVLKNFLQRQIDKKLTGPGVQARQESKSFVWGEVSNGTETVQAQLTGPDGYTLTANTSLSIAQKLVAGDHPFGYHTPAGLFGENLILETPGVTRRDC